MSGDLAAFEQELRSSLDKAGLINRMKALFMDAALDCISQQQLADNENKKSPLADPRLLKPSQALLDAQQNDSFGMGMTLVVDFLRQYGLLHTLNCLKAESNMFPADDGAEESPEEIAEERKDLCTELGVALERSALEMLYEKSKIAEIPKHDSSARSTRQTEAVPEGLVSAQQQQQQQQQNQSATAVTKSGSPSPKRAMDPAAVADESDSSSFTSSSASSSPERANNKAGASSPSAGSPAQQQQQHKSPARVNYPAGARPSTAVIKHSNGKARETTYTVEWFDGGEFVRYNQITGQQFVIEYMRNCRILIFDAVDSITMDDCEDCELVVATCENSIFLRTCTNCTFTIACKQLRTRDCKDCKINLFTTTDPVVESSTHMHFYPFNLAAPNLISRFKAARFDARNNRFVHVFDFTKDDAKLHGGGREHFIVHWPDHGGTAIQRYGEAVDFENVNSPAEIEMLLRGEIEPAASLEKGAGKSLNIKTGAQQWKEGQAPQQQQQQLQAPGAAVSRTTTAAAAPSTTVTAAAAAAPKTVAPVPAAAPAPAPVAAAQPSAAPAAAATTAASAAAAKAAVPALNLSGASATAAATGVSAPKKQTQDEDEPAGYGGLMRKDSSDSSISDYSDSNGKKNDDDTDDDDGF